MLNKATLKLHFISHFQLHFATGLTGLATLDVKSKTRMWAYAQRDGRPAKYRWRTLRKFRNSIPCTTPQSLTEGRYSSAVQSHCQYRRTQDLDAKSILQLAKFRLGTRALKNVYIVYQIRRWLSIVQSLVSDVAAVTKPKRETGWNLLGFLKLANRSQPLVGRNKSLSGHHRTTLSGYIFTLKACIDNRKKTC